MQLGLSILCKLIAGRRRLWAALPLWLAVGAAHAEVASPPGFAVRNWDADTGLPQGEIRAVVRTPDGYLWLGTAAGLVRFDGVRFVALTTNSTPALGDERVRSLFLDRAGKLWVGTQGGTLARREAGGLIAVPLDSRMRGIPINAMAQEPDGTTWLATEGAGLVRWRESGCDFFGATNGLPGDAVSHLVADKQGTLWAIAGQQLIVLEAQRWHSPAGVAPLDSELVALAGAADGGLWVATTFPQLLTGRGGRVFKLKDRRWVAELTPYLWAQDTVFSRVTALVEDREGRLWAGTPGAGIFYWDANSQWRKLAPEGALAQLDCACVATDREDALWVGTTIGELLQLRERPLRTLHLPPVAEKNILRNACATRDGSVWVGTDGVGVFRCRDGQFTRYTEEQGLTDGHIGVVFEDRRTNLWVGTWSGLFQLHGERFERVPGPPALSAVVLALCEDREGGLWAGTSAGVLRMSGQETKVYGRAEGVDHFYIRGIAQDQQGRLWLAIMDRGLYLLQDGRFARYGAGQWTGERAIRAIHPDEDGALWIATFGAGLARLKDGRFTQWTTRDGLPSDRIVAVTEDAENNLWCSSENGIFGSPKSRLEAYRPGATPRPLFWHLSVADGLETRKCSGAGQPVIGRSADGKLWIPNWRALAVFDPAEVPSTWSLWPVAIEEAVVDGKPQPVAADGVVRVSSIARSYEFHYTSPNLRTPERVRFRYRLKDSDSEWVEANQRRVAYYGRLSPGQYEFQVMAGSPAGAWQESPRGLRLTVVPQLWERRSVQAAAALGLLGAVAAIVWAVARARLRRRLARIEAQQTMERERRRIARDLHDDLGAGMAEVVLLGELARQQNVPAAEVQAHVADMTEKTRLLVAAMDEIVWTVNPRNDSIPNLASYVAEHARKFFKPTAIHCRLDIMPELPQLPLPAAVRHNLFLAVKEALHNVVKHSGAREVWLRMRWAAGEFTLEVQDDGRGFEPKNLAEAGDGLENMRHRLEAAGGRAEIASEPGRGTKVRFSLPVGEGT